MDTSSSKSFQLVSLVGYLIGIPKEVFDREELNHSVFDILDDKPEAKVIRCLCSLRNSLLRDFDTIYNKMLYDLKNLDTLPDYINQDCLKYLASSGINLIKANCKPSSYLIEINQLITSKISDCQKLFPLWLKWKYIKSLFAMPNGSKEPEVQKIRLDYRNNIKMYPFRCYINWPVSDNGYILANDSKFASLLYSINGDTFSDLSKTRNISENVEHDLLTFITEHKHIDVVVDCENSDPFKLCAVLRNIRTISGEHYAKINKIILFDDPHTIEAWKFLQNYIKIPVEHEIIERVNDYKSLVDIRMTAGTCKEHYQNQIDGFLLVSSDSDFWGLISSLPTAGFFVLIERQKTGVALKDALSTAAIPYCFIDDFTDNIRDIKVAVLVSEVNAYLTERAKININCMIDELLQKSRIDLSAEERKTFFEQHIKTLKPNIDVDGTLSMICK